ncbi:HAD family hydrolase [Thaumasiovibrio subtropicus]|uniref:HAD family hydrolase n=1 Tax=Thaumasiovibrio subtropicus TaxID=1891207 RepID=UPI000B3550D6|nr:HAD family phosphatase [Thaumasiovibrio subtropicus]
MTAKKYYGYLFNMDGAVVDSEPLTGQALAMACADFGAPLNSDLYKAVMGQSWQDVLIHFFIEGAISPNLNAFNEKFQSHYQSLMMSKAQLIPGVQSFLVQLREQGKKCAIVSSGSRGMVEQVLDRFSLRDHFNVVVSKESVNLSKPDPMPYQVALAKLRVDASRSLAFEDSRDGISAAKRAGCKVIAVQHDYNGGNDMSLAKRAIRSYSDI